MDPYDESANIDTLLRSSLRGDQANQADVVAPGAPDSADTAARRRRIRIGENAFEQVEGLRPLPEDQQLDEERAAFLRAAVPEAARTPINARAVPQLDRDLWADCDRCIEAQRGLTGTHVSWSSAQRVIFLIMQLIPITEFAPEVYEWGPSKTKNTTMVKLSATYEIMRPAVVKMLTDVTNATGTEARTLIDDAKQALFGGEVLHNICVYMR